MKLNAVFQGITAWQPFWDEFLSSHTRWVRTRLREGDEICFVPISHATAYARAFGLRSDEIAAETAFATLCRQFKIVGVRIEENSDIHSNPVLIRYEGVECQIRILILVG